MNERRLKLFPAAHADVSAMSATIKPEYEILSNTAEPEARQTLDSGFTAGAHEPRSAPHRVNKA